MKQGGSDALLNAGLVGGAMAPFRGATGTINYPLFGAGAVEGLAWGVGSCVGQCLRLSLYLCTRVGSTVVGDVMELIP